MNAQAGRLPACPPARLGLASAPLDLQRVVLAAEAEGLAIEMARIRELLDEGGDRLIEINRTVAEIDAALGILARPS